MRYLATLSPVREAVRRPVALVCLACYLLAWTGVPMPVLPEIAADSEPFPCQDHHCGCTSAHQCWTSCCCMTLAQRMAWARQHGVQPPAAALASMEREMAEPKSMESSNCEHHCCCQPKPKQAELCTPASTDEPSEAQQEKSGGWINYVAAQRCRGVATQWVASGAVLILCQGIEVRPDTTATFFCPLTISRPDVPAQEPAVPPPRAMVA